jgi:chorismate--pyruvate lyase
VAGAGFGVRLIGQGLSKPFIGESRLLGLSARRRALAREVVLFSQAGPLVLARTVIPALALRGEHCALARLGNRPLGEVLFAQRDLRRTSLAFSQVYPADWMGSIVQDYSIIQPVWGRRSLYQIGKVSLLVCEFFLSAVLSLEKY